MRYKSNLWTHPNEKKRSSLLSLGIIAACAMTLTAFEWRNPHSVATDFQLREEGFHLIEPDLQPILIAPSPKAPRGVVRAISSSMAPIEPSAEPILTPLEPTLPMMKSISSSSVTLPSLKSALTSSNEPKEWTDMGVHELPYFPACKSLKNAEERFQCTQDEMHDLIQTKFHFPKVESLPVFPEQLFVSFIVDEYGAIGGIRYSKEVPEVLDKEIKRVFAMMPLMNPGKVNGRGVRIQFAIPFQMKRME
jgi:hypothetical protein